jgi:type I restriction enzyme S subunit
MTAQQLKNSILQMAVSGKLVPQDPNDEPASVLLERIRKEKERLVKEGKIKKEKNPSYIFRGADNLPYEKLGKNESICIADEVPFDIPESWEWCRLGSIIELQSGQDLTPDKYNDNHRGIPYITGASNIDNGTVIINRWTEHGRAFAYQGDLLLTCKGTVGTMAFLQEAQVHIARQIMAIKPSVYINSLYTQIVLETLIEGLKATAKSMIPGISREDVLTALFPLPPADEQSRIVGMVLSVLPHIEEYGQKNTEINMLSEVFPELLKKSVLQQAVMGKLVPQDPKDEPASVLLARIQAEKEKLIKAGKLKKDKNESVIFRRDNSHYEKLDGVERCIDDEIPFEIPDSWEWARLKTVGITQTGNTPSKTHPEYFGNDVPFIGPGDIQNANIDYCNQGLSASGRNCGRITPKGSILQVCIGGSIGKAAIALKEVAFNQQINAIIPIILDSDYLHFVMISPYYIEYMRENAGGTATPIINRGLWDNLLVPIPPQKEQKRIAIIILETFKKAEQL